MAICAALLPVAGAAQDQQWLETPFKVLDSHPLCTGKGKIAYSVAFEAKNVRARFGIVGVKENQCSIKTRRGDEVMEVPIPCPDEKPDLPSEALLKTLPRAVDVSGNIIGCLGLTDNAFIEGNWRISADTPLGTYEAKGDLTDPKVVVVFVGPSSGPPQKAVKTDDSSTMIALLFSGMDASQLVVKDRKLELSTYFLLSPDPRVREGCGVETGGCNAVFFGNLGLLIPHFDFDVVRYVDGDN